MTQEEQTSLAGRQQAIAATGATADTDTKIDEHADLEEISVEADRSSTVQNFEGQAQIRALFKQIIRMRSVRKLDPADEAAKAARQASRAASNAAKAADVAAKAADNAAKAAQDAAQAAFNETANADDLLAPFLTEIFYREVEVSDSMQTLFRGNCLASKIMSHCFKTFGSRYLKNLLEPHMKPTSSRSRSNSTETQTELASSNNQTNISYEIDLSKLESDGDINVNQQNLLKLTKQILESILSSAKDFPPQLNSMCICLRQALSRKYSDSESNLKAVGTVIFLRFINPAIVSPLEFGIIDKPLDQRITRGLMLVSKIIQNIANNVGFSKEEHMLPFNDFVRSQFEPLQKWVAEISSS